MFLRSPLVAWSLSMASGGGYAVLWCFQMLSSVNRLSGRQVYDLPRLTWALAAFAVAWSGWLLALAAAVQAGIPCTGLVRGVFLLAVGSGVAISVGLIDVGLRIRALEHRRGVRDPLRPAVLLLAHFALFSSIWVIHRRIQRLSAPATSRQPGRARLPVHHRLVRSR
ncbi:MAG: hypothetical protein ACI8PZ_001645 [Myxococcota bacterium]|jgi:hypothetical protein